MRVCIGPMLTFSVSVSPYVLFLVDSGGLFLLVSSMSSDSYHLSMSSTVGFPELGWKDLMETPHLDSISR